MFFCLSGVGVCRIFLLYIYVVSAVIKTTRVVVWGRWWWCQVSLLRLTEQIEIGLVFIFLALLSTVNLAIQFEADQSDWRIQQ